MYKESQSQSYSVHLKIAHWLIVAILPFNIVIGYWMKHAQLTMSTMYSMIQWHKWIGMTVFVIMAYRICAKILTKPPESLFFRHPLEKILKIVSHLGLYILVFSVIFSGYLMSCYGGYPVNFLGINWAISVKTNPVYTDYMRVVHFYSVVSFLVLLSIHIIGYVTYLFRYKTNIINRMI